ncbi:unnamed protein product [Gongylonema pulchrum]|uniref:ANF_receptor domain-containing protein n=1 Tax=Gongylonema pulchrum TaxID=637853 RepID=A0A183DDZ4_9BILA|nr:unnamed protein product [Gongylonema pulchrum]
MIFVAWLLFVQGNAAAEVADEISRSGFKIEGQITVPESFGSGDIRPSLSRVLVNYGEHVGFVRIYETVCSKIVDV